MRKPTYFTKFEPRRVLTMPQKLLYLPRDLPGRGGKTADGQVYVIPSVHLPTKMEIRSTGHNNISLTVIFE